jgi:Fe-S-cluster-containing hydrogenase component 2
MYVDPEGCVDCGACVPACTSDAIFVAEEVPEDKKEFVAKNAAHYGRQCFLSNYCLCESGEPVHNALSNSELLQWLLALC